MRDEVCNLTTLRSNCLTESLPRILFSECVRHSLCSRSHTLTSLSLCCMCIALCLVKKVLYCNLIYCHHRCILHMFKIYFALVGIVNPESLDLKSSNGGSIEEGSVEKVSGLALTQDGRQNIPGTFKSIKIRQPDQHRKSQLYTKYL